MSGFEQAKRSIAAGDRLRFYQDFYGRQWVRVVGGWRIWRNRRIRLDNREVIALKELLAQRRRVRADDFAGLLGPARTPDSKAVGSRSN